MSCKDQDKISDEEVKTESEENPLYERGPFAHLMRFYLVNVSPALGKPPVTIFAEFVNFVRIFKKIGSINFSTIV